jgi:hypothetical protein
MSTQARPKATLGNATLLTGKSRKKTTFSWQWSLDGKAWTNAGTTGYASTLVSGLTLGSTYWFRVTATVAKVQGDWSQAVSLLVDQTPLTRRGSEALRSAPRRAIFRSSRRRGRGTGIGPTRRSRFPSAPGPTTQDPR